MATNFRGKIGETGDIPSFVMLAFRTRFSCLRISWTSLHQIYRLARMWGWFIWHLFCTRARDVAMV